jgi:hypothetical protein
MSSSRADLSEHAQALALQAVAFLAENDDYLCRFLDMTGLDAGQLRNAVHSDAFLAGVLDHLLADESLLLAFCASTGNDPSRVWPLRLALDAGPGADPF